VGEWDSRGVASAHGEKGPRPGRPRQAHRIGPESRAPCRVDRGARAWGRARTGVGSDHARARGSAPRPAHRPRRGRGTPDAAPRRAGSVRSRGARGGGGPPARPRRDPGVRRGAARQAGGAGRAAHVLRARPGPHPPLDRFPASCRQDAGLRVPRRPPADAAHPRPGGRAGREVGREGAQAQRRAHRGDRARPRLRARPGRACERGRARPVPRRGVRPRRARRGRRARPAQPHPRGARRGPQPLLDSPGAEHPRGRGGELGRPHRLLCPRPRGRRRGRPRLGR
jgi:hypothetical protein